MVSSDRLADERKPRGVPGVLGVTRARVGGPVLRCANQTNDSRTHLPQAATVAHRQAGQREG